MRNQGGQGLYRGGENKQAKPTKSEKVSDFIRKMRLKAAASKIKNSSTT